MKKFNQILFLIFLLAWGINVRAQERTLELVKDGRVVFSSLLEEIEYMTVVNRLSAPKNVHGAADNGKIIISWGVVLGATSYSVFRSSDGNNFMPIGSTSNDSFTDNSPLSGSNYYCIQAFGDNDAESVKSAATQPISCNAQVESGIYLGLIGFNQKINDFPINQLTQESKQGYYDFIDTFNQNNDGTALYYAVDQAIQKLQNNSYPADLNSVHIVTFTDGIDNYSLDLYDEIEFGKYSTPDECGNFVKSRLTTEKVAGIDIMSYAVGSRHSDVNSTRFTATLNNIATSSAFVYELDDMSAVEKKFKEIAKNITEVNKTQNITVSIAGGLGDNESIRFTFDLSSNTSSPINSTQYIEGTFQRTNATTRKITNITAYGLTLADREIIGTRNAETGLFDFTFKEVCTDDKTLLDKNKTLEWWGTPWQKDTEFNPDANTKTEIISHSAAIILVLDCTKSLDTRFAQMQTSAKLFIATLLDQAYSEMVDPEIIVPNYNGHEYVDLGLPSGLKWATTNIGANSPEKFGNYFAWGETAPKSSYTTSSSLWNDKSRSELYIQGVIDSQGILTPEYDAATVNWCGSWRMPTYEDFDELLSNCNSYGTTRNGVKGYLYTSKINGNSIFIPTAMYYDDNGFVGRYGNYNNGYYWGSSVSDYSCPSHLCLYYSEGIVRIYSSSSGKSTGFSVRAVSR